MLYDFALISMSCFVIVISLILKKYLPSYFEEKAKNLATKEDVSSITREIEEVKSIYQSETEHLRAFLATRKYQLINIKKEKRKILLDFYRDCLTLVGEHMQSFFQTTTISDMQSIIEYQKKFEELFWSIYKKFHHIELYLDTESEADILYQANCTMKSLESLRIEFNDGLKRVKLILINNLCKTDDEKKIGDQYIVFANSVLAFEGSMRPHIEKSFSIIGEFADSIKGSDILSMSI